ncbi:Matrix metalloproteinase-27 [Nymphaea thermarum]|nr:Matrix metalloproteinase-27 [Nymphaea thermarum]
MIKFLQVSKMVSTLSFVAILMLLVQTNCMEWVSGHNGDFHYQARAEFMQLSGCGKGESHEVLPSLKRYLQHLGYLDTVAGTGFSLVFDEDLEAAVKKYQAFFSLNATGILDTATVHQLIQPRCGVPDIIKETSIDRIAQLHVGFYRGRHLNCPIPFDGPDDVLAHAVDPPHGMLHINADRLWAIDPEKLKNTEESFDLQSVAVHEIGHLLGLGHSTVPEAIMFPSLDSQTRKVELHGDDIAGINAMYPRAR